MFSGEHDNRNDKLQMIVSYEFFVHAFLLRYKNERYIILFYKQVVEIMEELGNSF